jgi:hypothetical protein
MQAAVRNPLILCILWSYQHADAWNLFKTVEQRLHGGAVRKRGAQLP